MVRSWKARNERTVRSGVSNLTCAQASVGALGVGDLSNPTRIWRRAGHQVRAVFHNSVLTVAINSQFIQDHDVETRFLDLLAYTRNP